MGNRWTSVMMVSRAMSAFAAAGLLLSSCSGSTPSSPEAEVSGGPEFVSSARRNTAAVELHRTGKLQEDGSVLVTLRTLCPPGFSVVEGPLTLMQGPLFQEIFGEGFFTTRCDGHWHLQKVPVRAPEGFERGVASASATLMVENLLDPDQFLQGDDHRVLKIR